MVWHPILSALEIQPGHWQMLDGFDRPHGRTRPEWGISPSIEDR